MPFAVLTGDLIASTRLAKPDLERALATLQSTAQTIADWQGAPTHFTRSRGDGWQILVTDPHLALRAALTMRAALRAGGKTLATRIAIATGDGTQPATPDLNHASGPAFTASGQALDAMTGPATIVHSAGGALAAATRLADHISTGWTQAQARAMALMLPPDPPTHAQAAQTIGISRQAVEQALAGAAYPALTQALAMIEQTA